MLSRKNLWTELVIVLGLSLGASAIYSLLQLLEAVLSPAGLSGSSTSLNASQSSSEYFDLAYQLVGIALALVPVALAVYLLRAERDRFGGGFALGAWRLRAKDFLRSLGLAAVIGIPSTLAAAASEPRPAATMSG